MDMWAKLEQAITNIKFAEIVDEESKRTILCPPHMLDRVRWLVEQHGAERWFTVRADAWILPDRMYIVDVKAMDAHINEVLARPIQWRW